MFQPDELLQILVGGMDGNAAHGNIGTKMFATPGQSNAKRARRRLSVFKKQLVKISHAVEQQVARVGRLDFQELGHHRRGLLSPAVRTRNHRHLVHGHSITDNDTGLSSLFCKN